MTKNQNIGLSRADALGKITNSLAFTHTIAKHNYHYTVSVWQTQNKTSGSASELMPKPSQKIMRGHRHSQTQLALVYRNKSTLFLRDKQKTKHRPRPWSWCRSRPEKIMRGHRHSPTQLALVYRNKSTLFLCDKTQNKTLASADAKAVPQDNVGASTFANTISISLSK